MTLLHKIGLIVCLLPLAGCHRVTFVRDANAVAGEQHEEWTDFFLFGLVGKEQVTVEEFCPGGNASVVRTGGNVATGLVGGLTLGIYTPRKVYVTCAASATTGHHQEGK
jgi:hypothetical protein